MNLSQLQKFKIVLVVNVVVLFFIILATPFFVRQGIMFLTEEIMEATFLAVELSLLIFVFRHYDIQVRKNEEKALILNSRLERREQELIKTFEHLGKVNVQVSMIKELFDKMKAPVTRVQLKETYSEFLRLVCSVTKKKNAFMRIVDLEMNKTLFEQAHAADSDRSSESAKIGNNQLAKMFRSGKMEKIDGISVFYSKAENFFIKAFIFIHNKNGRTYSDEEISFLRAVANQCEIMFLLYNSRYYSNK